VPAQALGKPSSRRNAAPQDATRMMCFRRFLPRFARRMQAMSTRAILAFA